MTTCPFCGRDPFHYVDNGVGMEAVAVTCCENGDEYFRGARPEPETVTMSWEDFQSIGNKLAQCRTEVEDAHEALDRAGVPRDDHGTEADLTMTERIDLLQAYRLEEVEGRREGRLT